jgi:type I restriction enzyme, S subunit
MKLLKLGEIFKITSGGTPSRDNPDFYNNGTIPWIKTGDLKQKYIEEGSEQITELALEKSSAKIFPIGTVLIAMYGATIGATSILNIEAATNQACAALLPIDKVLPEYLYYFFKVNKEKIINMGVGGAQPNISASILKEMSFPLQSIEIQRTIVNILDKAQELIDKRKAQIEALDELVKSRFIGMFGDPDRNPKGWEMTTIGKIATDVRYGTSKPAVDGGKYTYLRMNNITYGGYLDLENLKYIDIEDKELEKCIVRKGDVLFNRTNSSELIGKTCVFDLEEPMIIAGYIIRVRLIKEVLPIYLSMFLNSSYGKGLLKGMAKGAVNQANINAQELKSINIAIPPIELQSQFADFVTQVDKLKFEMQKSLKELENNFNSLMQRAFNGELFN